MDNEAAKHLKALIKQYGNGICDEPKRCRALLMDLCGKYSKEVNLIALSLEINIPQELLTSQNIPYCAIKNRLIANLSNDHAVVEHAASWCVEAWAYAFSIRDTLPDITGELCEEGLSFREQGNLEEALRCFEEALTIESNSFNAWFNKGSVLGRLERYEKALFCYEKALEIDAENISAWVNKGRMLFLIEQYKDALNCFKKALDSNPQDADVWVQKGFCFDNLDDIDSSLNSYEKALDIDPQHVTALKAKGKCLSDQGHYDEAIYYTEKALAINPRNVNALNFKASQLAGLKLFSEALNCCEEALNIDPHDADALNNQYLLSVWLKQGL